MRERLDETIAIPSITEELLNTNDAVGRRVKAEHEKLMRGIIAAQKRLSDTINSFNATFAYRVSLILDNPDVVIPHLPAVDGESDS